MHTQEMSFFGLRHRDTFELIRINDSAGGYESYCQLTSSPTFPVLELKSLEEVHQLLMEDTPSYNAVQPTRANWGDFLREELVPVKVRVTRTLEDLEVPDALQVQTLERRDIPRRIAEHYAGQPLATDDDLVQFWLVNLPEGVTLENARQHIGTKVYPASDIYGGRRLLAVMEPPEEYFPLVEPGRGALFLASCLN